MSHRTNDPAAHRPEWTPEEITLSEILGGGIEPANERPLPDPEAILLLAAAYGEVPPLQKPIIRALLSRTFLTAVGVLPIAVWFLYRSSAWIGDPITGLTSLLDPALLTSLANRLAESGAPGWETGAVLVCVFLYLSYEYLLTPPRST